LAAPTPTISLDPESNKVLRFTLLSA
jgi:hypothetical protein